MREDYESFQKAEAEVVALAHEKPEVGRYYFRRYGLPFPGLADEHHRIYDLYDVQSKALSLGQRPALFIVDRQGIVRYAHRGTQQWQIPTNREVLARLARLGT